MKFILMVVLLYMLTDPVLAKPADNTSGCLLQYSTYMNDFGTSHFIPDELMLDFIDRCLPADSIYDPANSGKPQHQKLLQTIDRDRKILTIKT